MYTLTNNQLTVETLDPVADQQRMGARYCTGGYIFQVHDHRQGVLLSGPTYPDAFNTFDGQGIPDAFNLGPLRTVGDGAEALIIGVGLCELKPNYPENAVKTFCAWNAMHEAHSIRMSTVQTHGDWSLGLTRTVQLMGRTVRSETHLHNTGRAAIPVCWFPHPFYPQTDQANSNELIKLNMPVTFDENSSYVLQPNGFIARKNWPWVDGRNYLALNHEATSALVVQQRHPKLGLVTATCSYVPGFFPIWGNPHTFSWEPFLERTVAPGQELTWWIDYDF
jgi:hypothetical protein